MRRKYRPRRLESQGTFSQHEAYEAEMFYRGLLGLAETGRMHRGEFSRIETTHDTASFRHAPLEQFDAFGPAPSPWAAEHDNESDGLPGDDEESSYEFDAEFAEPDPSPNNARAPFASLFAGAAHWPVISSHPQGRIVSYRTVAGAWIGRRARSFGANRSGGTRYHIGVDLFGRFGDPVVAIEDGRIVRFFPFCCGENKTSWALLVQHAQVVVNYGEVAPDSLQRNRLSVGSNVAAGQVIARVGRNPGGSSMIHFETYATGTNRTYRWMKGRSRPERILNPTRSLLDLQERGLPRSTGGGTGTTVPASPRGTGGTVLHNCRSGEGPPAALPDPQGRGLRPLVYRGRGRQYSRNPTVGDAQMLLNRFLTGLTSGAFRCGAGADMTEIRRIRGTLTQAPLRVDCRFGLNTEKVTKMFQRCVFPGRPDQWDGKIGPTTWRELARLRGTPDTTSTSALPGTGGGSPATTEDQLFMADTEHIDENDWYSDEDFMPAEVPPTRRWARCTRYSADDARWAADNLSIDYRHLIVAGMSQAFSFTAQHLERLCRLNRFDVTGGQDQVLFGLRGCKIISGASNGAFVNAVQLSEDLPDHFGYHCVVGVWKRSIGQIAVFKGSTVPNWGYMCLQVQRGGRTANMLPTGRYLYNVGRHRAVNGAFILRAEVVVLRSNDDLMYETTDLWDRSRPADNIHPGFNPRFAEFSSAGCQTVSGGFSNGRHSGDWAIFRERTGLDPNNNNDRFGDRFVYALLTGREARLMSTGQGASLHRLRFGSMGPAVRALQTDLSRRRLYTGAVDGDMGPATTMAYIQWQQARDNSAADGIVTPTIARALGFDLLRRQSVPPTRSRSRELSYEYE